MDEKRYRVRLVRPVFETTIIEVEATSEDEAILEAIYQADTVPQPLWEGKFEPESYFYDVHSVEDLSDPGQGDCYEVDEDDRKYLLLRGDLDSGTGAVPFQPWLTEVSDLMVADLCSGWSMELEILEQAGVESYYASLDRQVRAKNGVLAKVIPFRRPQATREEEDAD